MPLAQDLDPCTPDRCLSGRRQSDLWLFSYCTPIPTKNTFTTKAVTGETIQVRLVPGREGENAG